MDIVDPTLRPYSETTFPAGNLLILLSAILTEINELVIGEAVQVNLTSRLEVLQEVLEMFHASVQRIPEGETADVANSALKRTYNSLCDMGEALKAWAEDARHPWGHLAPVMEASVTRVALSQLNQSLTACIMDLCSSTRFMQLPDAQISEQQELESRLKKQTLRLINEATNAMIEKDPAARIQLFDSLLTLACSGAMSMMDPLFTTILHANKIPVGLMKAKVVSSIQNAVITRNLELQDFDLKLANSENDSHPSNQDLLRGSYKGEPVSVMIFTPGAAATRQESLADLQGEVLSMSSMGDRSGLVQLKGLVTLGEGTPLESFGVVLSQYREGTLMDVLHGYFIGENRDAEMIIPPPLSLSEKLNIILQIAKGLQTMHEHAGRPKVHGKLSSSCILLRNIGGSGWECGINDIGCHSFRPNSNSLAMMLLGGEYEEQYQLRYAAPERLRQTQTGDTHRARPPADIYSFGVVMAEILSEQVPLACVAGKEEIRSIVVEDGRPDAELPDPELFSDASIHSATSEIIRSCWSDKEEDRMSSAQVVVAIEAVMRGVDGSMYCINNASKADKSSGLQEDQSSRLLPRLLRGAKGSMHSDGYSGGSRRDTHMQSSRGTMVTPPSSIKEDPEDALTSSSAHPGLSTRHVAQGGSVAASAHTHSAGTPKPGSVATGVAPASTSAVSASMRVVEGKVAGSRADCMMQKGRPLLRCVGTDSLEDLFAELRDSCQPGITYDLGGRIVRHKRGAATLTQLVVPASITLRNGILDLGPSSQLVLKGDSIRLEQLTIRGGGVASTEHEPVCGLLWLDGCESCVMKEVNVMGGSQPGCHSIFISGGGTVELLSCSVQGSVTGSGVFIQDPDSGLTMQDCVVRNHAEHGVHAVSCASCSVRACILSGNGKDGLHVHDVASVEFISCQAIQNGNYGLYTGGEWGRVQAHGCIASGNGTAPSDAPGGAVKALGGAVVELCTCSLEGGDGGEALHAEGEGTSVKLVGCILDKSFVRQGGASVEAVEKDAQSDGTLSNRISEASNSTALSSLTRQVALRVSDSANDINDKVSLGDVPWSSGGPRTDGAPVSQQVYVGSDSLESLCTMLETAVPGQLLDLAGRRLKWRSGGVGAPLLVPLTGSVARAKEIKLDVPNVTLLNGTLELRKGEQLTITSNAKGAWLEDLQIRGPGSKPKQAEQASGLVFLDGVEGVTLKGCSISGCTVRGCGAVLACGGTTATLTHCSLTGSAGNGLTCTGAGTHVVANSACSFSSHCQSGVTVSNGASLELEESSVMGNGSCGVRLTGVGSTVTACKVKVQDNKGNGVMVDSSCTAKLSSCGMLHNGKSGVFVNHGKSVKLLECNLHDNKGCGLRVQGSGSTVVVGRCEADGNRENGFYVTDGASADISFSNAAANWISGLSIEGALPSRASSSSGVPICAQAKLSSITCYSNKRHGVSVCRKAKATLQNCNLDRNVKYGLFVGDGSQVSMDGGKLEGNWAGGIATINKGSQTEVRLTKIADNGTAGVHTASGASMRLEQASIFAGCSEGSVHAQDSSTHVELHLCKLDKDFVAINGAEVLSI